VEIPVDQLNPQAYQEAPPEQLPDDVLFSTEEPPPPPEVSPEMPPPSPEIQPPPAEVLQPPPEMPFPSAEAQPPQGYPPVYTGGGFGPSPFDIPEAGRSGINEIIMGPEGINEAPLFTCGFVAAILTVITLVILLPFKESNIYAIDVLVNRGFWPYAMIYNLWLGFAMIAWKTIGVQKMKGALKKPLIPPQMKTIIPNNTDGLLQNIKSLYQRPRSNPLVYRLWMALLIFKQTSLVERVDAYCSQQSDAEGGNMDASYQIINFCLWSEPIFGFLGTVQGLGLALAGFGNIAGTAMEIDTIKGALSSVTGGLSTAFDTTLLGLLFSVIMMVVITLIKKDEDGFLASVDVWITENLMSRLKAPPVNLEAETDEMGGVPQTNRFKKIIEETFQAYIQSLEGAFEGWKEGFRGILGKLGEEAGNMGEQFKSVEPLVTDFRAAMNDFSQEVKQTSEHQKGLIETVDSQFAKLDPLITGFGQVTENLNQERQQLDQQIKEWGQNFDTMAKNMAQELQGAGKGFLAKADQFQQQVNENTTKMSAAVGQKLIESGQGILAQFQQHMNGQEELVKSQVDNLSKLSDTVTRNMTQVSGELLQKLQSQASGMETIQTGLSASLDQFMETFKAQLSEWFNSFSQDQTTFANNLANTFTDNFNKVGQDVMGQFGQYSQNQDQGMSQVIQDIKEMQQSFGTLANQLSSAFNQLNQDMGTAFSQNLQKTSELIQQCQNMAQDITNSSSQSVQALSTVSTQISALVDQQKEANQLINQHASGISATEEQQKRGAEDIRKLISDQQQLIQALNEGVKNQAGNNSGVKEVLDGINAGIESIKPSLVDLAKILKDKDKEQVKKDKGKTGD
jgi:ABC-type transporter Mla subunit MlaD